MRSAFLSSSTFWSVFMLMLSVMTVFFGWELGLFSFLGYPAPFRASIPLSDYLFGAIITLLASLNAGLYAWQRRHGSCPTGTKRATAAAWTLGGIALICPACTVVPIAFFGFTISLSLLAPFVPLLQAVATVLLGATLYLLLQNGSSIKT